LFLFCFAIIVTGVLLYTLKKPKLYKSVSQINLSRVNPTPIDTGHEKTAEDMLGHEEFQSLVDILESPTITSMVDQRLRTREATYNKFLEPFQATGGENEPVVAFPVLHEYRRIIPQRLSWNIRIEYIHHDADIAATVVNLFAQCFKDYQLGRSTERSIQDIAKLETEVHEQAEKVSALEQRTVEYKQKFQGLGLDHDENIFLQELLTLKKRLIEKKDIYTAIHQRWQQVGAFENAGGTALSLLDLSFISGSTHVSSLMAAHSQAKKTVGQLEARYRNKHPKMIQANQALALSEKELVSAIQHARNKVYTDYQLSKINYEEGHATLQQKEKDYLDLEKNREHYNGLTRQLDLDRKFLEHLRITMSQESVRTDTRESSVNIFQEGVAPTEPFSPNLVLNMAMGIIAGSFFGIFMVYFTAFVDNRVKSPFDIEQVIKLPLIGVIPQIRKKDSFEKARIIESAKDHHVKEAFRSIFSTLGVNDQSKDAQVILNTSTIPGEGKSFVSTNLAFTFAESGYKVILLDCDLRLPNVAKSLKVEHASGLLDYIRNGTALEEVVEQEVFPNLDILAAGGRSRTPMTIFNNESFPALIEELRQYYDKIIIDSPPLAAVSDALNIVPIVDGIIFVIKYNTVKRNTAATAVRKLSESGKPIFGVVLNNMQAKAAEYYYSEYYTGHYKNYYAVREETPDETTTRPRQQPQAAREQDLGEAQA
jgi:capsular exopolysaccharide synthesis family protein